MRAISVEGGFALQTRASARPPGGDGERWPTYTVKRAVEISRTCQLLSNIRQIRERERLAEQGQAELQSISAPATELLAPLLLQTLSQPQTDAGTNQKLVPALS